MNLRFVKKSASENKRPSDKVFLKRSMPCLKFKNHSKNLYCLSIVILVMACHFGKNLWNSNFVLIIYNKKDLSIDLLILKILSLIFVMGKYKI